MTNRRPLKCFLSYEYDVTGSRDADAVAAALHDLNVDTYDLRDIVPGEQIEPAVLGAIQAADFVCLVLSDRQPSANLGIEVGFAIGLGKPVMALAQGPDVPFHDVAQRIQFIRVKPGDLSRALPDIRRFVRHVRPKDESSPTPPLPLDRSAVDQANARLIKARQVSDLRERGRALIDVVASLFSRPDSEVLREDATVAGDRPDLLVWSDPLVSELGGPIIIECKYYGGSSGSVLVNARRALDQLANYVAHSSAGLGLLVFDHNRPTDIKLSVYETPKVLSFYVGDLIEAVAAGKLTDEIWRRRARAARLKDSHGDAG